MTRHYLDHASTSPLRPEARDAMVEWLDVPAADPARIHTEGQMVRSAVEFARDQVASLFGTRNRSVVFTASATEAIATACHGAVDRGHQAVCPAVEHSAVLQGSAQIGAVHTVGVDASGQVDTDAVIDAIGPDTAIVHVQWGNHEVGTLQPVAEIVAAARERGVLVHVDAAQAAGRVPIAFDALGADLMSVSAHKFGGPPGIGALLVRRGVRLAPLLAGADQERGRRAGFENVPAIMGFGAACDAVAATLQTEHDTATAQVARIHRLADSITGVTVVGHRDQRLPHIACMTIEGVEPQGVLVALDQAGVAAHSGSSCASESIEPSPVLAAMGAPADRSLRISVGWSTTDADLDSLERALPAAIDRLRALRPG